MYLQSGTFINYRTTPSGCVQTDTLILTINQSTSNTTAISACAEYTWSVNRQTYTESGTYTYVTTNESGCPHTEILELTIDHSTTNSTTTSACDEYTWLVNGQTYTESGTYTYTTTTESGCMHTDSLILTINYSTSKTTTTSACDEYNWSVNGQMYTESGTYTYNSTNESGCPHTDTLILTINHSTSKTTTTSACDEYNWSVNGQTYMESGTYIYNSTNVSGCPHTDTLILTINHSTSKTTTASACDEYNWSVNGQAYTESGTYIYNSTNESGCPHTDTLILTINQSTSKTTTASACDEYNWSVNGQTYTESGTYTYNTTNESGCPHKDTLVLTINHSSSKTTTASACSSYTWSVNGLTYSETGTYTYITTNASGCPHTEILDLTITGPTLSVTCPGNATRAAGSNCRYAVSGSEFNAVINSPCQTPVTRYTLTGATTGTGTSLNGVLLNKGITTIKWTATSGSLTRDCSFTVTVTDQSAPIITCPVNITMSINGNKCSKTITVPNPALSDNCGVTSLSWTMSGATSGGSPLTGINYIGNRQFNVGVTTVVYTAKDAAGNIQTCSFTVTLINSRCTNNSPGNNSVTEEQATDIKELAMTVTATPNPSLSTFELQLETKSDAPVMLEIYDMYRKLRYSAKGNPKQSFKVGQTLPPGIYIAIFTQGDRQVSIKLIRQ
jgi:hypothetical protein